MWQPQSLYNQFVLRRPTILNGKESIRGLYNYPAAKILVIHGNSFCDEELFLSTFRKKEVKFINRSWKGEPDLAGVRDTLAYMEKYKPDTIIAVGGGSVIDGSKICRLLYEFPFYKPGESYASGETFRTNFIAIPTTIGSGAEVSSSAVYVNHEYHTKEMIVIHDLQPSVIIYDSRYVESTPERLLVISAMDGLAHMLEGYVSKLKNKFAETLSEKGVNIYFEELSKLLNDGISVIDYDRLLFAGYLGGVVQNHCIVGAAHAIAHQMTDYGYSHSEAVALILPTVIRQNSECREVLESYDLLARRAGFNSVGDLLSWMHKLCEYIGLSENKKKFCELLKEKVQSENFINNVFADRGGKGNPVEITRDYLGSLLEKL